MLVGHAEADFVDKKLLEDSDVYALTPSAMLACEKMGIPHLTDEDLYSFHLFRKENEEIRTAVEELFSRLDSLYADIVNFRRAFTANIYWFSILFSDLFYVTRICAEINRMYAKVYIVGERTCRGPLRFDYRISASGFIPRFATLENKVRMFATCLSGRSIFIETKKARRLSALPDMRYLPFALERIAGAVISRMRKMQEAKDSRDGKKIIFVLQDGYEVNIFRRRFKESYICINILEEIDKGLVISSAAGNSIKKLYDKEVADFTKRYFSAFAKDVEKLFDIYLEKIVSRIEVVRQALRRSVDAYKPVAFFYSQGSNTVYEELAASIAMDRDIPIYYFQHGSSVQVFHNDPYQKYHEHNQNVRKIQVLHSQMEKRMYDEVYDMEGGEALGSMKLYNVFSRQAGKKMTSTKVLYCPACFNYHAHKQVLYTVPDKEMFEAGKDILRCAGNSGLGMDIKTHPGQESYQREYFSEMIRAYRLNNMKVLWKLPAERIIDNYGLLVLDYISTVLIPVSFVYNIPVIMYLKDVSILNPYTAGDLAERYHLVRNREELNRSMELFKHGKLPTKFSMKAVDRYVFPVKNGDPALRILDHIACESYRIKFDRNKALSERAPVG
jgi:hypothetical protein